MMGIKAICTGIRFWDRHATPASTNSNAFALLP